MTSQSTLWARALFIALCVLFASLHSQTSSAVESSFEYEAEDPPITRVCKWSRDHLRDFVEKRYIACDTAQKIHRERGCYEKVCD